MSPQELFDDMVSDGDVVLDLLDQRAWDMPDKTYIHYGEDQIRLSFAELKATTDRMAAGLVAMGLQPGQSVSVLTRNSLVSVLAMYSIWRAGGVFAPVNFNFKGDLLRYQLNDTAPFALITDPSFGPVLMEVAPELGLLQLIVHEPRPGDHDYTGESTDALAQHFSITTLLELKACQDPAPDVARSHFDTANIVYTSGTTGPSKGVVQPFRWMNHYAHPLRMATTSDDVLYCDLPMYHVGGAFAVVTKAIWLGNTVGLWDKFSPTKFWDRIAECGASCCILLDVMISWLMAAPEQASDKHNSLNKVHMQPLPASHHEVAQRFGIDFVTCGFGQTESGVGFIGIIDQFPQGQGTPTALWKGLSKEEYRRINRKAGRLIVDGTQSMPKGFMGLPNPLLEVAILDEDDNQCPPGVVGQLAFRPRYPGLLLKEYFRKPEATIKVLRNCWFHTGDACKQNPDGSGTYLFVDRMGGFFRVRGENVSSYEVETLVASHPKVRTCAAVPVPACQGDEDEIAVFVELKEGEELDEATLRAHTQIKMPKYMQPAYIRFVDALPVTPTNKIEKYKLKGIILAEISSRD